MKRIFLALFLFLVLCSQTFAGSKEVTFNLGADPRTIDPILNSALDGAIVIMNSFEGLVRINSDDKTEPGCAHSWDISGDGLTWTFHLRDNLKWSDGEKLTAKHFKDAIIRGTTPETGAPHANYFFFIKNAEKFFNSKCNAEDVGVRVPDDETLILELEYKNPLILDYLAFENFSPIRLDIIQKYENAWATKPESYISNGPFMLENWKHGDGGEITLIKNPHYWDADNVKINRLRLVFINDGNTAFAAFKAGRIDYLTSFPLQLLPLLIRRGEVELSPSLSVSYFDFNVRKKPFDDVRIRQAFSLAIDRKIICEKILMSGQTPATGFVCPIVPGSTPDKDFRIEGGDFIPVTADIKKAKRLLAEAGYPDGKNFPKVTYKYNSNPGNKIFAEVLQAMWKQNLGIEVELSNEEWKVFLVTRRKGDFNLARATWVLDFNDAANILEIFTSTSPQNESGYNNPAFDEYIKKSAYEMDHTKRMGYLHEAEKILMADMPASPLLFSASAEMKRDGVRNIFYSPRGPVLFRNAEAD